MEQPTDRSRKKHSLFRTGHSYGNIVLNFQNAANSEFGVYARAFHTSGQVLFERMLDKSSYNSLEGCPIIFLYRHALELYLKAIVLRGDAIMRITDKTLLTNRSLLQKHSLLPFLPLLKQTFDAVGWTWELDIEGLHTFEEVVEALKQHRTRQKENKLKAGDAWQDTNLVFCNAMGSYLSPDYLVELFHKLLEEAGLPDMRFHDLRHSAATLLLSMGVHPKVVQEILGHSRIGMTMDTYSHVLPSMQKEAMDGMNNMFG